MIYILCKEPANDSAMVRYKMAQNDFCVPVDIDEMVSDWLCLEESKLYTDDLKEKPFSEYLKEKVQG
jgi:hypothetical protein